MARFQVSPSCEPEAQARNSPYPSLAHFRRRPGITLVEISVTLVVMAILAVIIAQCIVWSLRERLRFTTRRAALELAANVLEAARAQPWDQLDSSWAEAQTIPADLEALLPDGKLVVSVEPGPAQLLSKQVTVEVHWQMEPNLPGTSVRLTTLLSARESKQKEGKP